EFANGTIAIGTGGGGMERYAVSEVDGTDGLFSSDFQFARQLVAGDRSHKIAGLHIIQTAFHKTRWPGLRRFSGRINSLLAGRRQLWLSGRNRSRSGLWESCLGWLSKGWLWGLPLCLRLPESLLW